MASFCGHCLLRWSVAPINYIMPHNILVKYHKVYILHRWDRFPARFEGRIRLDDQIADIRSTSRMVGILVPVFHRPRYYRQTNSVFVSRVAFYSHSDCGRFVHIGSIFVKHSSLPRSGHFQDSLAIDVPFDGKQNTPCHFHGSLFVWDDGLPNEGFVRLVGTGKQSLETAEVVVGRHLCRRLVLDGQSRWLGPSLGTKCLLKNWKISTVDRHHAKWQRSPYVLTLSSVSNPKKYDKGFLFYFSLWTWHPSTRSSSIAVKYSFSTPILLHNIDIYLLRIIAPLLTLSYQRYFLMNQCPYTVGAEFVLLLNCPSYGPQSCTTYRIRTKILQMYTFTRSQTMKVEIITKPGDSDLPSIAFLKLYDRRFLEERMEDHSKYRWDQQRDAEVQRIDQK